MCNLRFAANHAKQSFQCALMCPCAQITDQKVHIFSTVILASHSSYSLSPLGVAMRSSQLLIGSFYLF